MRFYYAKLQYLLFTTQSKKYTDAHSEEYAKLAFSVGQPFAFDIVNQVIYIACQGLTPEKEKWTQESLAKGLRMRFFEIAYKDAVLKM